jgi:ABC-type multidrug transport system fused ATPase/permease subunit
MLVLGTKMNLVKKVLSLLRPEERRKAFYLLAMILLMALFDAAGVASIAPFMAVVANPEVVSTNEILLKIYQISGFREVDDELLDVQIFMFFLGVTVFVVMLVSIGFKAWTLYVLERFTQQCNRSLSRQLVSCYLQQSYSWFLNKHSSDIGKAVLSEVNAVVSGLLFPMMMVIAYGTVTVAIMLLLFIIDARVAVSVGLGLGSIYVITYLLLRKFLTQMGEDRVLANTERYKVIQEGFSGIKDIKFFGLEETLLKRFDGPSLRYAKHTASQHIIGKMPRFLMEILAFGGMLGLVLYLMVSYGNFLEILPLLALYTLAAYKLIPSLQQVYSQITTIRFCVPALNLLYDDLTTLTKPHVSMVQKQIFKPLGIDKGISLEDVTFCYAGQDQSAVNAISLSIKALNTIGFVGSTGSGKTTTVDLILGLLSSQQGQIKVDDVLIDADNVREWQKTIGYVPQHIYISDDSIMANIAFGYDFESIDQTSVERAAKVANLHDFVVNDLPHGYNTKVGEQGVRLSGGQRQRIGIARALYADPQVLVFDEATSALDSITEKAVMDAVNCLNNKKTIIIIAHRLSTVRDCDNIFLLDKGKLVGQGTYDELVSSNTSFREMVKFDN